MSHGLYSVLEWTLIGLYFVTWIWANWAFSTGRRKEARRRYGWTLVVLTLLLLLDLAAQEWWGVIVDVGCSVWAVWRWWRSGGDDDSKKLGRRLSGVVKDLGHKLTVAPEAA